MTKQNIFLKKQIIKESKPVSEINTSGIYFLLQGEKLVYVGKTTKGFSRILQHENKKFDRYTFFKCNKEDLDEIETKNIIYYKPIYNKNSYSFENITIGAVNTICKKIHGKRNINRVRKVIEEFKINIILNSGKLYIKKEDISIITNNF